MGSAGPFEVIRAAWDIGRLGPEAAASVDMRLCLPCDKALARSWAFDILPPATWLNGDFGRIFNPLHRDFSLDGLNPGKGVQMLDLKTAVGGNIRRKHPKKKITIPCHQMAFHDI